MKILINNKEQDNIKAIQVDDYWVIVDTEAEIKENDFCTTDKNIIDIGKIHNQYTIFNPKTKDDLEKLKSCWKIIASTKFIDKSIPIIKFVEQSVEDYSLENAKKFAEKHFDDLEKKYPQGGQIKIDNILSVLKVGVECGYKFGKKYQAKSSDKKYTEKQLEDAITIAFDISEYGIFNSERDKYKNKIIQSLNQSKLPDVINLEAEEYCQLLKSKNTSLCLRCQFLHPECYKLKTKSTPEGEIIEIKI